MIIDFTLPTCVLVRKFAKLHRSGELVHGKPVKKENGYFYMWNRSGGVGHFDWMPIVCTPTEYFKRDRKRSYTVDKWSFTTIQSNKKAPVKELVAKLMESEKLPLFASDMINYTAVIAEAAKFGFNADKAFLMEQVDNINYGFKQNRILPDGSGAVFSPIDANGIVFRFAPVTADSQEYVC